MRPGLVVKKLGMSSLQNEAGVLTPISLLHVESCNVIDIKKSGAKSKVCVGAFDKKITRVKKSEKGYFAKHQISPKKKIIEFEIASDVEIPSGTELKANHFVVGQFVDVSGQSTGKGFAGAMKRHNFSGLRASHGVSISHRAHGSTGQCQDPGKVFKGKKMAGHMGAKRVTKQNLQIIHIDEEKGLIAIKGSVPGKPGSLLTVKDAVKRAAPSSVPYPYLKESKKVETQDKVEESEA